MRAVECTEAKCVHIHASSTPGLRQALLEHFATAHPAVPFGERAAASLIEEAGYEDLKHVDKSVMEGVSRVV